MRLQATSRCLVDQDLETPIEGPDARKNLSRRLRSLAVKQLRDILQTQYSQEPHLREYDENELAAARKLLDDSSL